VTNQFRDILRDFHKNKLYNFSSLSQGL